MLLQALCKTWEMVSKIASAGINSNSETQERVGACFPETLRPESCKTAKDQESFYCRAQFVVVVVVYSFRYLVLL